MAGAERKPNFIEKGAARGIEALAPLSKTLDKLLIGGGVVAGGLGLALKSAALVQGAIVFVGLNVATYMFAGKAEHWARKKLGK